VSILRCRDVLIFQLSCRFFRLNFCNFIFRILYWQFYYVMLCYVNVHQLDITLHPAALQTEWYSEYVRSRLYLTYLLYFTLFQTVVCHWFDRFLKLVGVKPQQTTTGMSSGVFVPTTVFFCYTFVHSIYAYNWFTPSLIVYNIGAHSMESDNSDRHQSQIPVGWCHYFRLQRRQMGKFFLEP